MSAQKALLHPYFYEKPLPKLPDQIAAVKKLEYYQKAKESYMKKTRGDVVEPPADNKKKGNDRKGGNKDTRDSQKDTRDSKEPRKNKRDQDDDQEWVPRTSTENKDSKPKASEKKNEQSQSRKNKDGKRQQEDSLYVAKSQQGSEYVAKAQEQGDYVAKKVPSKIVTSTVVEETVQVVQKEGQKSKTEAAKSTKDSKQTDNRSQTNGSSAPKKQENSQPVAAQKKSALLDPSLVDEYEGKKKQTASVTYVKVETTATQQKAQNTTSSSTKNSLLLDPSVMEEYFQHQEDEVEDYVNMEGIMHGIGAILNPTQPDESEGHEATESHNDKKKKKKKKGGAAEKDPLLAQGELLLKSMHKK